MFCRFLSIFYLNIVLVFGHATHYVYDN